MNDGPFCAHLHVGSRSEGFCYDGPDIPNADPASPYVGLRRGQMLTRHWWECRDCKTRFVPEAAPQPATFGVTGDPRLDVSDDEFHEQMRKNLVSPHPAEPTGAKNYEVAELRESLIRWMKHYDRVAGENTELRQLVHDLYDEDEPCRFDHHGYCQEHGWFVSPSDDIDNQFAVCPHARAKAYFARVASHPAEPERPPHRHRCPKINSGIHHHTGPCRCECGAVADELCIGRPNSPAEPERETTRND